jgi:hypothetical protein
MKLKKTCGGGEELSFSPSSLSSKWGSFSFHPIIETIPNDKLPIWEVEIDPE